MRNLIIVFVTICIFLFTSCTKEDHISLDIVDNAVLVEEGNKIIDDGFSEVESSNSNATGGNITIQLQEVSESISGSDLIIDFSSSLNLTQATLIADQDLDFTDSQGRTTTLSLKVKSF